MKLTDWYPADIKPIRTGVYEREMPHKGIYSYWNGEKWCGWGWQVYVAERNGVEGFISRTQDVRWRGLARKPRK